MAGHLHDGRLRVELDLVPMIDILLVLLVIFMLAQVPRRVLDIQLPAPRAPATEPIATQIVLELRDDGSYAINGTTVEAEFLEPRLRELYLDRPVKLLFVRAAPGRLYHEVIAAADLARGAGVEVIGHLPSRSE